LNFSVVAPIHNEEKNLLYSLPSLFRLDPDEVVFILDNCTDRSKQLIEAYVEKIRYRGSIKLIEVREIPPDWKYRVAYLFRLGYREARNDAILTMAGDVILDPSMRNIIEGFGRGDVKIISFGSKPYPLDTTYFLRRIISRVLPRTAFAGLFLFSRSAWLETELEEDAKRILKAQDTLTFKSIKRKYASRYIWTNSLHLRSRFNESKYYYTRGQVSYQVSRRGTLFMFLSSIVYMHPHMFVGYMHAKRMRIKQVAA
jgi:glycosyltransferase involved in cell wall biosynthesis